jgi:cytochrome P450
VTETTSDLQFDMYDRDIYADPYPLYQRLRDEAPLSYNAAHGFYAVSRFADTERVLVDRETFSSTKGSAFSFMPYVIDGKVELPNCLFIAEDPPLHTIHRGLVWRVFTPKAVHQLEEQIRDFSARVLDERAGERAFDFARDVAHRIPMRVIGLLLGLPEADQPALQAHIHQQMNDAHFDDEHAPLEGLSHSEGLFGDYLDWREANPADDLMSLLLRSELDDGTGTRRLTRDEVLLYVSMIAGAGSDTTSRLMEWTVKLLAEHPDQRRELAADRSLIPNAIEEVLRAEPPSYAFGRYVTADVEFHGETVPAGSVLAVMPGSANHDERAFADPESFDIHRDLTRIMSFGFGPHLCIGANLARVEGRILLEELLDRHTDWDVDLEAAVMTRSIDTRGWESLPVHV